MFSTEAVGQTSIAKLSGDISKDLIQSIKAAMDPVEKPPRSLAQARRRAQTGKEQVLAYLRSEGYYGARVFSSVETFSEEGKPPEVSLNVTPGPRFDIALMDINFLGKTVPIGGELRASIMEKQGSPGRASIVIKTEQALVSAMQRKGYPDVLARNREVIVDHKSQSLNVSYKIEPGELTRFGRVDFGVDAPLNRKWANRLSTIKEGDVFDQNGLNEFGGLLLKTGAFDGVSATLSEESISSDDGTVTRNVKLNMEPGKHNRIAVDVGFSTQSGVGMDISYRRKNLTGRGDILTLTGTAKTNEIGLGADYIQPYFYGPGRMFNLAGELVREDNDAYSGDRATVSGLMSQNIGEKLTLGFGGGVEGSQYEQDGLNVQAFVFDAVGKGTFDNRDSLLSPTKGYRVSASLKPSYNVGDNDGFFLASSAEGASYYKLSGRLTAAGRLKFGAITGQAADGLPANRRLYSGGGGSVRGFAYQSIAPTDSSSGDILGGRGLAEFSAELRYRGSKKLGYAAFIDGASVSETVYPAFDNFLYGVGAGLRYQTSFAPIRADIAIPLNPRDSDNDFQIYIGIGQSF